MLYFYGACEYQYIPNINVKKSCEYQYIPKVLHSFWELHWMSFVSVDWIHATLCVAFAHKIFWCYCCCLKIRASNDDNKTRCTYSVAKEKLLILQLCLCIDNKIAWFWKNWTWKCISASLVTLFILVFCRQPMLTGKKKQNTTVGS